MTVGANWREDAACRDANPDLFFPIGTTGPALRQIQAANTQLLQAVLRDPAWAGKLTEEDRRGLSPLFWSHVNPYGRFRLDMDTRLDLTAA